MSRDWTPDELTTASTAMKAAGQMSYEEFCTELEKQTTENQDNPLHFIGQKPSAD